MRIRKCGVVNIPEKVHNEPENTSALYTIRSFQVILNLPLKLGIPSEMANLGRAV